jgi:hypothetical protein
LWEPSSFVAGSNPTFGLCAYRKCRIQSRHLNHHYSEALFSGMGLTVAFVFTEFFLYAFGGLSKRLEWMKTISIFNYWDYSSVIIDGFFKVGDFIVLTILAIALLIIGMWIFEKKDIST